MKKMFFITLCLSFLLIGAVYGEEKTWTSSVVSKSFDNSDFGNIYGVSYSIPAEIVVDNITRLELIVKYNISSHAYADFSYSGPDTTSFYNDYIGYIMSGSGIKSFELDKNKINNSVMEIYVSPTGSPYPGYYVKLNMYLNITYTAPDTTAGTSTSSSTKTPIPLPAIILTLIIIPLITLRKIKQLN